MQGEELAPRRHCALLGASPLEKALGCRCVDDVAGLIGIRCVPLQPILLGLSCQSKSQCLQRDRTWVLNVTVKVRVPRRKCPRAPRRTPLPNSVSPPSNNRFVQIVFVCYNMHPILYAIIGVVIILVLGPVSENIQARSARAQQPITRPAPCPVFTPWIFLLVQRPNPLAAPLLTCTPDHLRRPDPNPRNLQRRHQDPRTRGS